MIEAKKISKSFDGFKAVNDVTVTITEHNVFGLVGTNGAGKSTVLRMIAGVYKPDEGIITVDEQPVFDKMETKKKIFFIADEPYFFANATAADMQKYYASIYEEFDAEQFYRYLSHFELDKRRKINTWFHNTVIEISGTIRTDIRNFTQHKPRRINSAKS